MPGLKSIISPRRPAQAGVTLFTRKIIPRQNNGKSRCGELDNSSKSRYEVTKDTAPQEDRLVVIDIIENLGALRLPISGRDNIWDSATPVNAVSISSGWL